MDLKEVQSKDVQAIIAVLKEMGIEEYEPRVVNQLLEFSYRYVTTILDDARAFSAHAGKKNIDADDIKAAIKSKVDYSFTTTPPREVLMEISKTRNKNPLPQIRYQGGIRLPPDRFCLHGANYVLKSQQPNNVQQKQQVKSESIQKSSKTNSTMVTSATATASARQDTQEQYNIMPAKRRRDEDEEDYDV